MRGSWISPAAFRTLGAVKARARRSLAAVLAAAAGVTVVVVMSSADGFSVNSFSMGTGAVWVASSGPGQLALLDGSSAGVTVKLAVAPPGNDLTAVQGSNAGYAINHTAGSIVRVDDARWTTSKAIQLIPNSTAGLSATATDQALYAIDGGRGLVQKADPHSLQAVGEPRSLSAEPVPGSPVVDKRGVMWVLDSRSGDLIRVTDQVDRTAPQIGRSSQARLVLADGTPIVVDPSTGAAQPVDPTTGEPAGDTACVDTNRLDQTVIIDGSTSSSEVYTVSGADGALRITDLTTGRCDEVIPGLATPGSHLGGLVNVDRHVFVADYSTGRVIVVDLDNRSVIPTEPVVNPGTAFELLDRDGFVFYNDRTSERAGVVHIDGTVKTIPKYDVADPGKDVHQPEPDPADVPQLAEPSPPPITDPTTPVTEPLLLAAPDPPLPTSSTALNPPNPRNPGRAPVTPGASTQARSGTGNGNGSDSAAAGGGSGRTTGGGPTTGAERPPPADASTPTDGATSNSVTTTTSTSGSTTQAVDSAADLKISIPSDAVVNEPVTIQITATTGSAITNADWTFGDGTGNGVTVTHSWSHPGSFTIRAQVTRASGDHEFADGSITITAAPDTEPPTFDNKPPNLNEETNAGSGGTAVAYATPSAHDNIDPNPDVSCSPTSGTFFNTGTNTVTCTASDTSTNQASESFTITVVEVDNEAPVINCSDITAQVPIGEQASPPYQCEATDNVDPNPPISCDPPDGSSFGKGRHPVSCTATDNAGNRSPATNFTVTVTETDNKPPTIGCKNISRTIPFDDDDPAINYNCTAIDNNGAPSIGCDPPDGSTFSAGTHTVNCTATDTAGNSRSTSFTVTITREKEKPEIPCLDPHGLRRTLAQVPPCPTPGA